MRSAGGHALTDREIAGFYKTLKRILSETNAEWTVRRSTPDKDSDQGKAKNTG